MKERVGKAALVLLSLLAGFALLEVCLRVFAPTSEPVPDDPPVFRTVDAPYLYGLDPRHPGISDQGLYDDPVPLHKPAGRLRVLVLGDSIAFGVGLGREQAFPDLLERDLARRLGSVDVVNSAVPGYTPWNELQYYRAEGRKFGPDVVLVAFCLNDVANPRLHWGYTREAIDEIPEAAIPNRAYDVTEILPRMERRRAWFHPLESRVYRAVADRAWRLRERWGTPTLLSGEDPGLGIEVLLGPTAEWRWLVSTYGKLQRAVEADGASLAIAFFPVAYQLDEAYPYRPLDRLMAWCAERGLACIDLLDGFAGRDPEALYLLDRSGYHDIWHLNEAGHAEAARAIADLLAPILSARAASPRAERPTPAPRP